LISIYRNKLAREKALKLVSKQVKTMPQDVRAGFDWVIKNYPRVAAHMSPKLGKSKSTTAISETLAEVEFSNRKARIPVRITPEGVKSITNDPSTAVPLIAHEATHVAQSLGNKDAGRLSRLAESIEGYYGNPMEISAANREAGAAANLYRKGRPLPVAGPSASKGLAAIAETPFPAEFPEEAFRLELQKILARRRLPAVPVASHSPAAVSNQVGSLTDTLVDSLKRRHGIQ
jgi:hypothetical protein